MTANIATNVAQPVAQVEDECPFAQVYADGKAAPIATTVEYPVGIPAYMFAAENCADIEF